MSDPVYKAKERMNRIHTTNLSQSITIGDRECPSDVIPTDGITYPYALAAPQTMTISDAQAAGLVRVSNLGGGNYEVYWKDYVAGTFAD